MTAAADSTVERKLALLAREIMLWNSQINLVTRVDTDARLVMLVSRCRAGWDLLQGHLGGRAGFSSSSLVDIGSGSGLPGLVWAVQREACGGEGPTYLVEPRQKRAWFLRRAARTIALERVRVLAQRWGEGPGLRDFDAGQPLIVSMKALRLDDRHVLDGLAKSVDGIPQRPPLPREVTIVRFLSTEGVGRQNGADCSPADAGLLDSGEQEEGRVGRYELQVSEALGRGEGPRLGLRRYVLRDSGDGG